MATKQVYAPNSTFSGEVAGVVFKDGVGEADTTKDATALGYFARHGYGIGRRPASPETPPEELDARVASTGPHRTGTPLRDAAVDPEPTDFLAPVNAGKADPHGPAVVAPEIHASGPKGVKPGDVHVDDVRRQDTAESALAQTALIDQVEGHGVETFTADSERGPLGLSDPGSVEQGVAAAKANAAPAKSASQQAWADYAVTQGMPREEADTASRAELIERFGS
jgi:hypothetical protein